MRDRTTVGAIQRSVARLRSRTIHTVAGLAQQETPWGRLGERELLERTRQFDSDLQQGMLLLRVSARDTAAYLCRRIEQVEAMPFDPSKAPDLAKTVAVAVTLSCCGLLGRLISLEGLMGSPRMTRLGQALDRNLPARPAPDLAARVSAWTGSDVGDRSDQVGLRGPVPGAPDGR
ncbi:MAG: hypothetical protein AB1758_03800 [Candidatus Eremiobacterota bacterium]